MIKVCSTPTKFSIPPPLVVYNSFFPRTAGLWNSHPIISLNNIQVEKVPYQKHLGILLDEKLNFKQHVDSAILKMNKGISVIILL